MRNDAEEVAVRVIEAAIWSVTVRRVDPGGGARPLHDFDLLIAGRDRIALEVTTATLVARLRSAATLYGFQLVKVEILHPRQSAPFVVIRAKDKSALASSTSAILHLIDPKARTNDDRTGWAYEGFLFEALDSQDVPFLITHNDWRGPHAGGGQWASDPSLYPFVHG